METRIEFLRWTKLKLRELRKNFLIEISGVEDNQYPQIVERRNTLIIDFYHNTTNVWISNITYLAGLSLAMVELGYIDKLRMSSFSIENKNIQTYLYNTISTLYKASADNLNYVMCKIDEEFNIQSSNTALIFYIFLGLYVILILVIMLFGYLTIKKINMEAESFLFISKHRYEELSKSANSLIVYIKA